MKLLDGVDLNRGWKVDVLEAYKSFVSSLHPLMPISANVDIIQFLFGLKPCVRTRIQDFQQDILPFKRWCHKNNFYWHIDLEGFVYISMSQKLIQQTVQADHSSQKHEESLGKLLGYPECCCKKIAELGEENIDLFEEKLCQGKFSIPYKITNPKNYKYGRAFISHVPCSSSCFNSLLLALKLSALLSDYSYYHPFRVWLDEIEKAFEED